MSLIESGYFIHFNRWLVYEEKLEDSDRWSKPHMPTTTFTALEEVRKGLAEQTVALNLKTDCGCLRKVIGTQLSIFSFTLWKILCINQFNLFNQL